MTSTRVTHARVTDARDDTGDGVLRRVTEATRARRAAAAAPPPPRRRRARASGTTAGDDEKEAGVRDDVRVSETRAQARTMTRDGARRRVIEATRARVPPPLPPPQPPQPPRPPRARVGDDGGKTKGKRGSE